MSSKPKQALSLGQGTQLFAMLADATRLRLIVALARKGEVNVAELCQVVGQHQPAISHHLDRLRRAKLVAFRKEGRCNYYRIAAPAVSELLHVVGHRVMADGSPAE